MRALLLLLSVCLVSASSQDPAPVERPVLESSPAVVSAAAQAGLRGVRLRVYEADGRMGGGSGTIVKVDEGGVVWVLTARHVVAGARAVQAEFFDHTEYGIAFTVLAEDWTASVRHDLALVRFEGVPAEFAVATTLAGRAPVPGERVLLAGYPHLTELALSEGIVSSVKTLPRFGPLIRHTALGLAGTSGGGVYSEDGRLLAVHVAGYNAFQHGSLSIPVHAAREWLGALLDG